MIIHKAQCWPIVIKHNVIKHNVIKHNVIKHNVIKHNVIKHNVIKHNVIKHNVIKHNVIKHNVIKHNVIKHNVIKHSAAARKSNLLWSIVDISCRRPVIWAINAGISTLPNSPVEKSGFSSSLLKEACLMSLWKLTGKI